MQAIWATKRAVAGDRHDDTRGRKINNFRRPWKKFHRKQGVIRNGKEESVSRYQGGGGVERHSGQSGCWDGDRRRPGWRLNSCGRQ